LYQPIHNVWINKYYSNNNFINSSDFNKSIESFLDDNNEPTTILVNRWDSPTYYLPLVNSVSKLSSDQQLLSVHQQQLSMKYPSIVQYIQSYMEEWMTNEQQSPVTTNADTITSSSTAASSLLSTPVLQLVSSTTTATSSSIGMRMYSKGSIVAPHVNRYVVKF
jgi:hypothetical protein